MKKINITDLPVGNPNRIIGVNGNELQCQTNNRVNTLATEQRWRKIIRVGGGRASFLIALSRGSSNSVDTILLNYSGYSTNLFMSAVSLAKSRSGYSVHELRYLKSGSTLEVWAYSDVIGVTSLSGNYIPELIEENPPAEAIALPIS